MQNFKDTDAALLFRKVTGNDPAILQDGTLRGRLQDVADNTKVPDTLRRVTELTQNAGDRLAAGVYILAGSKDVPLNVQTSLPFSNDLRLQGVPGQIRK